MVSESLFWVGPCPGHFVCLCELDCVSLCVCLQKGVGLSPLSLLWKAPKSRAGDSPAPPTLTWSSLARAPREKFFGEMCVWGSRQGGLGRFCWISLQCSLGMHLDLHPSSSHPLDPQLLPLGSAGRRGKGKADGQGDTVGEK